MWWQILPSFGICMATVAIPPAVTYLLAWSYTGSVWGRNTDTALRRHLLKRDQRITGQTPQKYYVGLDGVPDD